MEKNLITKPRQRRTNFASPFGPSLYIVFPALYCVINYGVRFLVSQNTYQKLKGPQR